MSVPAADAVIDFDLASGPVEGPGALDGDTTLPTAELSILARSAEHPSHTAHAPEGPAGPAGPGRDGDGEFTFPVLLPVRPLAPLVGLAARATVRDASAQVRRCWRRRIVLACSRSGRGLTAPRCAGLLPRARAEER